MEMKLRGIMGPMEIEEGNNQVELNEIASVGKWLDS